MVIAVIPSRFHSSRFPGKALVPIGGVPLVVRVAQRVKEAGVAHRILVATDDQRIAQAVAAASIEVHYKPQAFRSGSDRVADGVSDLPGEIILNVQGDEPLVEATMLQAALAALAGHDMGTVAAPLMDQHQLCHPDTVKVEIDNHGQAVDFKRGGPAPALAHIPASSALLHLGIYAYYRSTLERFTGLPSSPRELDEKLEQLRALEHGLTIGVKVVEAQCAAVNRPEDVPRVEALLAAQGRWE